MIHSPKEPSPVQAAHADKHAPAAANEKPDSATRQRILIAEDNEDTRRTLKSMLQLALGQPLAGAVQRARDYVQQALALGADVQVGHGHGPLNHGFAPRPAERLPL